MDKSILKKFAIESRQDLMDKIRNKIKTFYIDEDFNSEQKGEIYILSNEKHSLSLTNEEFKKRELLIKRIKELSLEQVIEEAAYTWFNRIIAIRYMEINDMLPLTKDNQSLGIRVLSSKDNTPDPEILKFTNLVNPELDIDFKKEKYVELKDDNDKFKYVLLLVCKKLGRVIPQVFDGVTDYIDILIPDNLLNDTGFITKVINEVPENNYNEVEIIGWLYQYYNQTEKDRVISAKKAYKKNEIPYATQLFTPDWIVKYMVENSLGRYWVEHNGNGAIYPSKKLYTSDNLYLSSSIVDNWKYFIKEQIAQKQEKVKPTDITFIDPCCGSGHILVYAFEVLYQIYSSSGYNKNEIPELILKNNIYGIDVDDRAGQLSILSIILKAREYDKNIFNKEIIKNLNILSIQESNAINENILDNITSKNQKDIAEYLKITFHNAKEVGSLLIVENYDYNELRKIINDDNTIFGIELREKFLPIIKVAELLSKKYDIVVTNPPYLNTSVMSPILKKYVSSKYDDVKYDLFSAFIKRNSYLGKENSYLGFMTPNVWMFISSYEDLRKYILNNMNINSLIHLAKGAFFKEATVDIVTFILNNNSSDNVGLYFKLTDFSGGMATQEKKYLEIINDTTCNYKYRKDINDFLNIPGNPIAYWIPDNVGKLFVDNKLVQDIGSTKTGMTTGNNDLFLRRWSEVNFNKIKFNAGSYKEVNGFKWVPYAKGGGYKKWKGFDEYVVNWQNNGYEIKNYKKGDRKAASVRSENYYFKKCITWSAVTSALFSTRILDNGYIYDSGGSVLVLNDDEELKYIQAILSSKISQYFLDIFNSTLNYQPGDIARIPIILNYNIKQNIDEMVSECCKISKEDWDCFETSWDFTRHPLLKSMAKVSTIRDSIANWNTYTYQQRSLLKHNEEELNKIFIDIYRLNDELTPEVDDKDVTIRKEDKVRDIKSFISYAVGCMFGRYSLDKDGLIYAGGDFDNTYQKYKKADGGWAGSSLSNYKYLNDNGNEIELSFEVDNDNIIPITDEAYFSDDIVEKFKTFIKTVYGDNTFNENMDFIAETLGKKGTETSEETIRRYFVNDFFNDHCKIYQKRPIYWLLDSGKKNGFKALIYMHRYNENLIPKARLDYLHRVQTTYEKLLSDVNYKLTTDLSMTDKKEAKNRQADLNAKLQEIKEYDEKIAHIANQRISIDLDDGVKVNYEKFKDILAKIK